MSRNRSPKEPRTLAEKRLKFWHDFRVYLGFCVFFVVLNVAGGSGHFWAIYPIAGWGLGVFMRYQQLYGPQAKEEQWEEYEERSLELEDLEDQFELPDRIPEKKYREDDMI